jgi:hypothetical protein
MLSKILEPKFMLPNLRMQHKKGALSIMKKEVTKYQSFFLKSHHHLAFLQTARNWAEKEYYHLYY